MKERKEIGPKLANSDLGLVLYIQPKYKCQYHGLLESQPQSPCQAYNDKKIIF